MANLLFIEQRGWTKLPESGPRVDVVPEEGDVGTKEGKVYNFVVIDGKLEMVEITRCCKSGYAGRRVTPQGKSTAASKGSRMKQLS